MRKNVEAFREKHGDTTRLVLFQLAALAGDYFLLLPRESITTAKKVANAACALALHGIAYKAAKYFENPTVQKSNQTGVPSKDKASLSSPPSTSNISEPYSEPTSPLVRPATP